MHRTDPTPENGLAPNVNGADGAKPWFESSPCSQLRPLQVRQEFGVHPVRKGRGLRHDMGTWEGRIALGRVTLRVMLWLEKWVLGAAFVNTSHKTEEISNPQKIRMPYGEYLERAPPSASAGTASGEKQHLSRRELVASPGPL